MGQKRHQNHGLRKICGCARRKWAKCGHSWHFNFKVKGGASFRFSVDSEAGKHIEGKGEAEALADGWRSAIRAGTFRRRVEAVPATSTPSSADAITLEKFVATYKERRAIPVSANDEGCLRQFVAFAVDGRRLGDMPLTALTEDAIELFFSALRSDGRAASTRNKYVQAIKALLRWANKKGYLARNPVADAESIKREKHAKRDRRLVPDAVDDKEKLTRQGEERRLLAVAGPHLQRLIIAALDTGMRRGELLSLEWRDVNLKRKEITVRAETTKTRTGRILPISSRLAAVLEMARTAMLTVIQSGPGKARSDDEQEALLARCYVFGDSAGLQIKNVKRAWETAVLKAHDYLPEWTPSNRLAASSRAAIDAIDLHFHDLRHEAGSRLLESGWPLHHVQHMLGHANLSQTSTYLNATRLGLHDSMRRFEDAASGCKPVASESSIEHPPVRNDESDEGAKPLVN